MQSEERIRIHTEKEEGISFGYGGFDEYRTAVSVSPYQSLHLL